MRRETATDYDFRIRHIVFGNALGNSIVGAIETTPPELGLQFDNSQVPGSASNSYEQIQQNGVFGPTSQLGDNIVLPIGDAESAGVSAPDSGAADTSGAPPTPSAVAGTNPGGGTTAMVAQDATATALMLNALNGSATGQSVFTGQRYQVAQAEVLGLGGDTVPSLLGDVIEAAPELAPVIIPLAVGAMVVNSAMTNRTDGGVGGSPSGSAGVVGDDGSAAVDGGTGSYLIGNATTIATESPPPIGGFPATAPPVPSTESYPSEGPITSATTSAGGYVLAPDAGGAPVYSFPSNPDDIIPPYLTANNMSGSQPPLATTTSIQELLMPGGNPIGTQGSDEDIRELPGGVTEAQALFDQLAYGGIPVNNKYPGQLVQLPGGGTVGLRTVMSNSPGTAATIDVHNVPNIPDTKIKFNPP